MPCRSRGSFFLAGSILLAVLLFPSGYARADEKADLLAAFREAEALEQKGDYAGAARGYERALKVALRVLGPGNPGTATVKDNLAIVYFKNGQYSKAEPLFLRALKIRESSLKPDDPDVARSLNNLAVLYMSMGQYVKVEPLHQRSLKIRESRLGPDHPDVA